jgi:hypothetical protein
MKLKALFYEKMPIYGQQKSGSVNMGEKSILYYNIM